LQSGQISAAGLDVLEEECDIKEEKELVSKGFEGICDLKTALQNHILLKQENCYVTPHNAWNSTEAHLRILNTTCENLRGFFEGKPVNVVGE